VIKKESHIRLVWTERNISAKLSDGHSNPFLVSLEHAFQNERELFFVMEFMQGGDLRFHLTKRGLMTEAECRFYAAEMVLALESMHRSSIIYRDFKPDNILLDSEGHVRLRSGIAPAFTYPRLAPLRPLAAPPEQSLTRAFCLCVLCCAVLCCPSSSSPLPPSPSDFGLAVQLEEKYHYVMKGNAGCQRSDSDLASTPVRLICRRPCVAAGRFRAGILSCCRLCTLQRMWTEPCQC